MTKFYQNHFAIPSKSFGILLLYLLIGNSMMGQTVETFVLGSSNNSETSIVWTGKIFSEENKEGVVSAVIQSDDGMNAVTDVDGNFEIKLKKRVYTFTISALGFDTKTIELNALSSASLSVALSVDVVEIKQVVVGGESGSERLKQVTPGLKRLGIEQLESQSKFFGEVDILRSLQGISGVSNTGEGASGFNVRGGNADQNLILQDGHLIFNPSHALGFFSVFHPDLVQHVDLYKGGIPSKYGGRLSSVLAVETKDGDKENFGIKGGIGLVSSRLSVEGPIVKDKVSFIVGSRYSYVNWIFRLLDNPNFDKSSVFFNDVTAKINGRVTPTTNIGVSFLRSGDDFQLGEETRFDYQTVSGEAYIKQLIGDKANITMNVNRGQYESALFDTKGNDQSKFTNTIDYTRGRLDVLYVLSENYKINVGTEVNLYDIRPGEIEPVGESFIIPKALDNEKGREIAFYLENQWNLNDKIELSAGVRYTSFANLGPNEVNIYPEGEFKTEDNILEVQSFVDGETIASYGGLEPRAALRYDLNETTSLKAGYARAYQYLAQISNTASATPIDIWQLSNRHIAPQYADNFSIGFFKNLDDNTYESSFEVFYKEFNGLIDYKDFADLLMNENIETELVVGDGQSYGVELNLRKRKGSLKWEANYTFSSSQRRMLASDEQPSVNRGEWYSSNYDIPHVLNMNLVKYWENSNFAINFTYRSGRPTTAPVSSFTSQNVLNVPIYSDRNQFRAPAFHRLDIAYTIGPFGKPESKWEQDVTLSVYNLYGRKNAYSVYFRQNPFDSVKAIRVATLGTIFPSITYNFSLK